MRALLAEAFEIEEGMSLPALQQELQDKTALGVYGAAVLGKSIGGVLVAMVGEKGQKISPSPRI